MIDRRVVLGGMLAGSLSAAVAPRESRAASQDGRLLNVRGTRLWIDDSGPRDAPVILYVHGGPGVGALEFETYMKPALADRARVISVDQRGALRSDPLAEGAEVSVADLVADFEEVRRLLNVPRWQLLGHSFGGMFAMHYALKHPDRVTRLSLENPAYDAASSGRWLAASAAQLLNGVAPAAAVAANRLAGRTTVVGPGFFDELGSAMSELGDRRQDLYVVQAKNRDLFSRLAKSAGLPDARWEQGQVPGKALLHSPDFYEAMMPRVKDLRMPILYIRGSGDHATSPDEIEALLSAKARMSTVPDAGHFVHVEAPSALADLLIG